MSLLNPSFLLGLIVLLYFSSFVIFAILRIATGISIQRIGYFSLRRISYAPREGIRIDIRGLGLLLHRPTFAQPTWITLRLEEFKVTLDIAKATASAKPGHDGHEAQKSERSPSSSGSPKPILRQKKEQDASRSRAWKKLTGIKNQLKKLHEKIDWFRLVDVFADNSSLVVEHVGRFELGLLLMLVDTRRKTVDRTRLFQHKKAPTIDQRPAEWVFSVRGVLFTPEGRESLEILDTATLNIHGLLYKDLPGLRDTSIAVKLGRIHVPYDDFVQCHDKIKHLQQWAKSQAKTEPEEALAFTDVMEELDRPGSREANLVQTVSDSKEFISSILRGIQEIQLAVSFIGLTKEMDHIERSVPIFLNASMNELGLDLHRLDAKSPAHRMYFSPKDVAHQALVAAISISVSLDEGDDRPERILYVPMATTTVKTTLPSKTVAFSEDRTTAERNANILFSNLVVTSPSIDLDPKHLPIVLEILRRRQEKHHERAASGMPSHHILSRLLPKANIKLSVHEPVIRVKLPSVDPAARSEDDYDLLISMVSSISFETESSYSNAEDLQYALNSTLRLNSHEFYYQTALGDRHDLLLADSIELKAQIYANPAIQVVAFANFQTLSIHMVRPEISSGVRQIVQNTGLKSPKRHSHSTISKKKDPDFLRPLPPWLVQCSVQGTDWSVDIAGIDDKVSDQTRGIALQLESWTAEYKQRRETPNERPSSRHMSKMPPVEPTIVVTAPTGKQMVPADDTDGRRVAIHVRGLEGFVREADEALEHESFLSLPRLEVAFSTSSDHEGPIFHVNSYFKAIYLHYSLYRFYAIGVAAAVVRKAFAFDVRNNSPSEPSLVTPPGSPELAEGSSPRQGRSELVTIDIRSDLLQLKARMPADPAMLLQIFGLEAGQHRWAKPFLRSRMIRLCSTAPSMKNCWARVVSIKALRVDLREIKRKRGNGFLTEQSYDIATDFIRVGVPHQLVVHNIFDNIVNVVKATEQLKYRFITGRDDYKLEKRPENPKVTPRISIRSKVLLFDIEDGPFDWRLGMIYRVGLVEQRQRLAREEAYRIKARHIEKLHKQGSSRHRHASTQNDDQRSKSEDARGRVNGSETTLRHSSESPPRGRKGQGIRYDPEGKCPISEENNVSIEEAKRRLNRYNAQSWKKRIDLAYRTISGGMREIRGIFWGSEDVSLEENSERIVGMPERPGLMTTLISDLHIIFDKPSFPIDQYPEFLHKTGKGMPKDMQYSLLIPLHVQIDMGEARMTLRDYPLPLVHVPAIRPGQSPRLPSWSLKTDFVIAEEFRGEASTKRVNVQIVPPENLEKPASKDGFSLVVLRTVSPVKTYSDINVAINTSGPTTITWGTSLQPAIQDMMQVIESFSKPQVDPSDRVGFWDKIRLSFHSRISVCWTGDGDVHLNLKGSRDPYIVTGHGAGFVMVWRKDVKWNMHRDDDPKKFMTVDAGEYVLAIPDFSRQARESSQVTGGGETDSMSTSSSYKNSAQFKKTIMKLSGNVRWLAGLVFERNLDSGGRSFEFRPHYDVMLRPANSIDLSKEKGYDAFKGFRSNWIHFSLAIIAPLDRDWRTTNVEPSTAYNSVHLTPRYFTHFFDWWSLFSGVMSLPIRQGKLFPGIDKTSKKFGRHLATIKYNILVSPLFMTHLYKHKDIEEFADDSVSATGLKLRLDSFMLDIHQRREEFTSMNKDRGRLVKTSAMKIHESQLDFISADLRAISARIGATTAQSIKNLKDEDVAALGEPVTAADLSRFHIPDNNFDWVDMDDFNELDWMLPSEQNPETKILPLAFAPRFTYYRQTDHPNSHAVDQNKSSPFGKEPTHLCVMSKDNDPRKVQCDLVRQRLSKVEEQIKSIERSIGEQELLIIRDSTADVSLQRRMNDLKDVRHRWDEKRVFLHGMLDRLSYATEHNEPWSAATDDPKGRPFDGLTMPNAPPEPRMEDGPLEPSISDFNNRFVIHNIQLKWNNSLRDIILRYVHQVSQRRGFIYYLSRRAVKFINDIVEEQNKKKHRQAERHESSATASSAASTDHSEDDENDSDVLDRINELLKDGQKTVEADDPRSSEDDQQQSPPTDHDLSDGFAPLNAFHVRMIAPQIQFQSEKNPKSVLLLTAKSMQLQVIEIMDKDRMADEISGLVQRRFSVEMDSAQFFVTTYKQAKEFRDLYWGNHYGAPQGSSWPPWVPFEVNYDFQNHPFGWSRVVSRTSASLHYEKYNTLRLKYNDEVSGAKGEHHQRPDTAESRIDRLWLEFPHIRAICESTQYYAMYVIVLDLLLYSEPTAKVRSERLEKIMLASDFSDLRGAPEMVTNLQRRIRQLLEIKFHFQINKKHLDRQGWLDNQALEQDLASCEDELFFMMKAITTSQRKLDDRAEPSQSSPLLQWYLSASEIVWHLMYNKETPLVEVQFNDAMYHRTDNSDGSNLNRMEIEKMHGLNLLHDAIYPEMLGPFIESGKNFLDGQDPKMFKMSWRMLEAIAGIPVLDQFEVDLFPLKIQLEREIGQKLFEYIFPGMKNKKGGKDENNSFSPMMIRQSLNQDSDDSDGSGDDESKSAAANVPKLTVNGGTVHANGSAARPSSSSSANLRLRATTNFPEKEGVSSSVAGAKKLAAQPAKDHRFNLFNHTNGSGRLTKLNAHGRPASSHETLAVPSSRSSNSLATTASSNTNTTTTQTSTPRSTSHDRHSKKSKDKNKDKDSEPSDDLSLMLSRASNYMTLSYVRIPSVVLSLSYKGKGERNIQDVHNFVFRMPVLEYRNKTWSNLDLALRLKKDVIRALISHTGAIIGNKFAHPRPSVKQRSRLRELAAESQLLAASSASSVRSFGGMNSSTTNTTTGGGSHYPSSDTDSMHSDLPPSAPRLSSTSSQPRPNFGQLSRTSSFADSLRDHAEQQQRQYKQPLRQQQQETHQESTAAGGGSGRAPGDGHDNEDDESPLNKFRINLSRKLTSETQKWRGNTGIGHRPPMPTSGSFEQDNRRVGSAGTGADGGGNGMAEGGGACGAGTVTGEEEKDKKKSVLLLGKRILGNALN